MDGSWGSWADWSQCSQICGGGTETRRRLCDSPAPAQGGKDCQGDQHQERQCNTEPCKPARAATGLGGRITDLGDSININRLILKLFTYLTTGPSKCRETPAVTKRCSRKIRWRRRWTYDKGTCRSFPYQCKRNGYNFRSKAKCEKTCRKNHEGWLKIYFSNNLSVKYLRMICIK